MTGHVTHTQGVARTMLAALHQPAAMVDAAGVIAACNDDFSRCLSRPLAEIIGQPLVTMLKPEDRASVAAFVDQPTEQGAHVPVSMPAGQFKLTLDHVGEPEGAFLCQIAPDLAIDSSRLRFLLEHLDQGVWNFHVSTGRFSVTDAWRRMRGLPPDHDATVDGFEGRDFIDMVHPADQQPVRDAFFAQLDGDGADVNIQYRRKHLDGHWIWILCRSSVMAVDQYGKPMQIVGLDTDITKIKENEAQMTKLAGKTQLALDVSEVGVWEYDSATKTVHWDDRLLAIFGLEGTANDRAGHLWETCIHPDDRERAVAGADASLAENRNFSSEYRIVRPCGEVRNVRSLARFIEVAGSAGKMFGVIIDITDDVRRADALEKAHKQLEHDSRHDALTGLANRRLLDETTQTLMARLGPNDRFGVLHLDLDFFKQINDSLGHAGGDAVLVHLAHTLIRLVGEDGLVCRIGGDEFVVLLTDVADKEQVRALCQSIIDRVAEPFIVQGQACSFGVSIGAAIGRGVAEAAGVFINADMALYAAKSEGRSRFKMFEDGMRPVSQVEASARQNLRAALAKGEIIVHYQPQFDARTLELAGAEALVRWECPRRGLLLPEEFMPLAYKSGLIARFDEFVMEHVMAQQTAWANAGLEVPMIALNLSLERLQEDGLLAQVHKLQRAHHAISIELLETAFLDDAQGAMAKALTGLRRAGIGFELDDFGSGHSSIVALQTVRPDRVKIDQRLVRPIVKDPNQIPTLRALAQIATLSGASVIVEGIETEAHLDAIAQLECEALQGFALARPEPADVFEKRLGPAVERQHTEPSAG